jgi:proteasome lid subunit RPN8/RPN11
VSGELVLAPGVARMVLDQALHEKPDECCGILVGPDEDHASKALPVDNVHENPRTEYEIDPDALMETVVDVESTDREIVGFYHSHPRGYAAFSKTDRARGSWAGRAYLLVSLAPLTFVGGRWTGEDFDEVDVRVEGTRP